jgi:hypothetical protein
MQDVADNSGYSVVENFCGHGTGRYIHMDPLVKHVFVFGFFVALVYSSSSWALVSFVFANRCIISETPNAGAWSLVWFSPSSPSWRRALVMSLLGTTGGQQLPATMDGKLRGCV